MIGWRIGRSKRIKNSYISFGPRRTWPSILTRYAAHLKTPWFFKKPTEITEALRRKPSEERHFVKDQPVANLMIDRLSSQRLGEACHDNAGFRRYNLKLPEWQPPAQAGFSAKLDLPLSFNSHANGAARRKHDLPLRDHQGGPSSQILHPHARFT